MRFVLYRETSASREVSAHHMIDHNGLNSIWPVGEASIRRIHAIVLRNLRAAL